MNLSALLRKKLKDDDVLEVLESYQMEKVVYDFDRTHENMEDVYWAPAEAAGFQLRFNQEQVLDTIFCYIVADEGFAPISPEYWSHYQFQNGSLFRVTLSLPKP